MRNPHPLTRITILIPTPVTSDDFLTVDDLIGELADVCGGVTMSIYDPMSVVRGVWLDRTFQPVSNQLVYIFADAPFSLESSNVLDGWFAWLEDLKLWCQEKFDQDIIWMALTPTNRVTTYDNQKVWKLLTP
jgi:hypothetical protein